MSLDATRWAWQQSLRPAAKIVLLSLADRADEYHRAFPSISRLVLDTGLDRKTVIKVRQELAEMGLISDTGKQVKQCPIYQLNGVIGRDQTSQGSTKNGTGTSPKNGTSQKRDQSQKRDDYPSQKRDGRWSQKRDTESTNESIREPTRGESALPASDNLSFPECDFDAFEAFLSLRARLGKPNNPVALHNTICQLRPLAVEDRNWALRQAVAQGHYVIYPRTLEELPSKSQDRPRTVVDALRESGANP